MADDTRRYWVMTANGPRPEHPAPVYTEPSTPYPNYHCWVMTANGPRPNTMINPTVIFEEPIPHRQWRIDGRTNDGYPYTWLLPNIEYIEPIPVIDTHVEHDYIDLYDYVQVRSDISGVTLMLAVTKQEIHLDDPKQTTYTIGKNFRTSTNSLSYMLNGQLRQLPKWRYQ